MKRRDVLVGLVGVVVGVVVGRSEAGSDDVWTMPVETDTEPLTIEGLVTTCGPLLPPRMNASDYLRGLDERIHCDWPTFKVFSHEFPTGIEIEKWLREY